MLDVNIKWVAFFLFCVIFPKSVRNQENQVVPLETQHDNGLSNSFEVIYGIVSIVANISSRSQRGLVNERMERAQNRQTERAYDMTAQTPRMKHTTQASVLTTLYLTIIKIAYCPSNVTFDTPPSHTMG